MLDTALQGPLLNVQPDCVTAMHNAPDMGRNDAIHWQLGLALLVLGYIDIAFLLGLALLQSQNTGESCFCCFFPVGGSSLR